MTLATERNAKELAENVVQAFKDNRATTVAMRKEDLIEVITHAYTAGAKAVINYYEGAD